MLCLSLIDVFILQLQEILDRKSSQIYNCAITVHVVAVGRKFEVRGQTFQKVHYLKETTHHLIMIHICIWRFVTDGFGTRSCSCCSPD